MRKCTIVNVGLLLATLGLAGCNQSDGESKSSQSKSKLEQVIENNDGILVRGKGINPPKAHIKSNYGDKVGRTAQLYVGGNDNIDIVRATLYEDGKELQQWDDFAGFKLVNVPKSNAGTHTYQFEVEDEDRNVVRSPSISVEFSGTIDDRIPDARIKSQEGKVVGKRTSIYVGALDSGDNDGIKRASLYEDGKLLREWNDFVGFKLVDIEKNTTGRHSYLFEVTDNDNHTVRSEAIQVEYNLN